jgi:thioredoxin-dependent peroxiredoxin
MATSAAACYFTPPHIHKEEVMALRIGDRAPDFEADTTKGRIKFHDYIGDGWAVLFSHPKNFTPVCTTELGAVARLEPEFTKRNTKVIGLSVDPVSDHERWMADIRDVTGGDVRYPLIGDSDLAVAKLYEMLPADAGETSQGRTAATNQTVRTVYIIGPDKLIKATLAYPMSSGRNFDEVLRLLDSIQLTAKYKVATPANWKNGEDVIIVPAVSDEEAKTRFPNGWTTVKPYLRVVPQPRG